jgi:hypothetical protein
MADVYNPENKDMATTTNSFQSVQSSIYNTSQDSISSNPDPIEPLKRAITQTDLSPNADLGRVRTNRTTRTGTSLNITDSRPFELEINFTENDPLNPKNWPLWYRGMTIGFMSFATCRSIIRFRFRVDSRVETLSYEEI